MTATTFLVIDTVVSTDWAIVVAVVTGAAFGLVWFALAALDAVRPLGR